MSGSPTALLASNTPFILGERAKQAATIGTTEGVCVVEWHPSPNDGSLRQPISSTVLFLPFSFAVANISSEACLLLLPMWGLNQEPWLCNRSAFLLRHTCLCHGLCWPHVTGGEVRPAMGCLTPAGMPHLNLHYWLGG